LSHSVDYFSSDSLRHDLKGKTVRGGLWTGVSQAGSILIPLATLPILARLLAPADYGIFAMAAFFTGFAMLFVDSGFAMATIQRKEITSQQVTNLFWISTALGTLMAVIVVATSPIVAWFYREPRVMTATCALAPWFIFSGLSIQAVALLRRGMCYRQLAIVQLSSVFIGQAVAVTWASFQRDFGALVAMHLAQSVSFCLGAWWMCQWRPGLPRRGTGVRQIVTFGMNLTGFSFANYFARHADNLLIGWWWGKGAVGGYDRAYKLFMFPLLKLGGPITSIAVPVLSRLVSEPARYERTYFKLLGATLMVMTPVSAFLAANARSVIYVLLGEQWLSITPIFLVLSICGLTQMAYSSVGWVLISQGQSTEMLRWGILNSLIIVLSFFIGLPWGPLGVAISYTSVYHAINLPLAFYFASRSGSVQMRDFWMALVRPLLLGVAIAASSILTGLMFSDAASPLIRIACNSLVAALVYAVGLLTVRNELFEVWQSLSVSWRQSSGSAPLSP
jgi:PST family polysaccharide transporter